MHKSLLKLCLGVIAIACGSEMSTQALEVVVANAPSGDLGTSDSGYFTNAAKDTPVLSFKFASSFTMTSNTILDSIDVALRYLGDPTTSAVKVSIFDDGIETEIATADAPLSGYSSTYSYQTALFSSNPTLTSGSTYYLVLELTTTGTNVTNVAISEAGASSTTVTTSGSPNYDLLADPDGSGFGVAANFITGGAGNYSLVYNITAVPEPSTYLLGAIASTGLGMTARRRKQRPLA